MIPRDDKIIKDFRYIMDILARGSLEQLEELAVLIEGFPQGEDDFCHERWIMNAISGGSKLSIEWMLSQGVDLEFCDPGGYTVLLNALERNAADKYEILELLLKHHAPLHLHGVNDWTAAHMAAARDDVEALKILVRYGADLSIKTRIDHYATPLEEAKLLNRHQAVKYLESIT